MILTIEQLKRLAEADDGYSKREVQDIQDTWNALRPVFAALKPIVHLWESREVEGLEQGNNK